MPAVQNTTMPNVFDMAQRSAANNQKCLKMLYSLQQCDPQQFCVEFGYELRRALIAKTTEKTVKRFIKFIVLFATTTKIPARRVKEDEIVDEEFPLYFLQALLSLTRVKKNEVRYWSCRMISETLKALPEDSVCFNQDVDILDQILLIMRDERALDSKLAKIRIEAIRTLGSLKDPSDPNCTVMKLFLLFLVQDHNISVRKAVLQNIAITRRSIRPIISRTRDVSSENRKIAFTLLGTKVNMGQLTIEQRIQILDAGLHDRTDSVRNECHKLIANWLANKESIIPFLEALQIEKYERVAVAATRAIISAPSFESSSDAALVQEVIQLITSRQLTNALSNEATLFFRIYVEEQISLQSITDDNASLQSSMNIEITEFVYLIQQQIESGVTDFTLLQLFKLAQYLDLADESGRRTLSLLLGDQCVTASASPDVLDQIFTLLMKIHTNENEVIDMTLEMLNTLHQPLATFTENDRVGLIERKLEELQVELKENERKGNQQRVREIQEEAAPLEEQLALYDELKAFVLSRSVHILHNLLSKSNKSCRDARMSQYETSILQEVIGGGEEEECTSELKQLALGCLTFYCLQSEAKAIQFLPLYIAFIKDKQHIPAAIRIHCVRDVFDICTWWGLQLIDVECKELRIVETLLHLLDYRGSSHFEQMINKQDHSDYVYDKYQTDFTARIALNGVIPEIADSLTAKEHLRTVAVEGFAKLLLLQRISTTHKLYDAIMMRLVILYFSPDRLHQYTVSQCLSVFFSTFTAAPVPQHVQVIQRIFIRCIKFIFESDSIAITQINVKKIGLYLLTLIQPQEDHTQFELRCQTHLQILRDLCDELMQYETYNSAQIEILISLMQNCTLIHAKYEYLNDLLHDIDSVSGNLTKVCQKQLAKCRVAIHKLLQQTDPPTESDNELDDLPTITNNDNNDDDENVDVEGENEDDLVIGLIDSVDQLSLVDGGDDNDNNKSLPAKKKVANARPSRQPASKAKKSTTTTTSSSKKNVKKTNTTISKKQEQDDDNVLMNDSDDEELLLLDDEEEELPKKKTPTTRMARSTSTKKSVKPLEAEKEKEEPVKKKPAPVKRSTTVKRPTVVDNDDGEEDEEEKIEVKPVKKKSAPVKRSTVRRPTVVEDSDEEEEEEQRVPVKAKPASVKRSTTVRRPTVVADSDEEEEEEQLENPKVVKNKPAPIKRSTTRRPTVIEDSDEEEEEKEQPKSVKAKPAPIKRSTTARRPTVVEDSDEEDDDEQEEELKMIKKKPASKTTVTARKSSVRRPVVIEEEDEDEEDEEDTPVSKKPSSKQSGRKLPGKENTLKANTISKGTATTKPRSTSETERKRASRAN